MRLLLTRPVRESEALAALLDARGHDVLATPLLSIHHCHDAELPKRDWQALLVTSANGARALGQLADEALKLIPVVAVGEASAEAARAQGFTHVQAAGGDVHSLDALAAEILDPAKGPLLHAAGSVLAGDLKGMLEARGFDVDRVVLYDAQKAEGFTPQAREALASGTLDGVLFYSPRTARHFATLVKAEGVSDGLSRASAYCLSAAIAAEIDMLGFAAIHIAAEPSQDALLALISA
jgi:uroporphyrinogen-III synthase